MVLFCATDNNYCPIDMRNSITLESVNIDTQEDLLLGVIVDNSNVVIRIITPGGSSSKLYTIFINESRKIDVNGDGIPDIQITLERVAETSALINFVDLKNRRTTRFLSMMGVG